MAIQRKNGTFGNITVLKRREGGAWVDVFAPNRAKRREAGVWEDLLPGAPSGDLAASASGDASGYYSCFGASCQVIRTVTTNTVTITATGGAGVGPTYAWSYVSGSLNFTATAPSAAATAFTANIPRNANPTAVWKCTVTRGVQTVEVFVNVSAQYEWEPA